MRQATVRLVIQRMCIRTHDQHLSDVSDFVECALIQRLIALCNARQIHKFAWHRFPVADSKVTVSITRVCGSMLSHLKFQVHITKAFVCLHHFANFIGHLLVLDPKYKLDFILLIIVHIHKGLLRALGPLLKYWQKNILTLPAHYICRWNARDNCCSTDHEANSKKTQLAWTTSS